MTNSAPWTHYYLTELLRKLDDFEHVDSFVYFKVKCKLVQALRLCTDRTAHRGSIGIALLFLDHGTRRG